MANYNGRRDGNNVDQNRVDNVSRSFRADLEDLVVDSSAFTSETSSQLQKLDDLYHDFDEFLVENLVSRFKMTDADARALGDMEKRIQYIEKNSWKLKIPDFAPMMDAAKGLKSEMNLKEDDIRAELNQVLTEQEQTVAKNAELLKVYHDQLMEDTKKVEDLEVENAGLLNTIPDITSSPLYTEVQNLKTTIDAKYADIDDLRSKIEEKENDNITLSNEIDNLDEKIRDESAEIAKINREKLELDKELTKLEKDLSVLKKTGTPEEITNLETIINDKKRRKTEIINEVDDRNLKINGYKAEKDNKSKNRSENLKRINSLNNEKNTLRSSVENNEREHRTKLAELTKERDEDSEEVRKYKRNLKQIEKLDISNRLNKYKDKKVANNTFKKELDKNRKDINDKFREYKITPPVNTVAGRAATNVANTGEVSQATQEAAAQAAQTKTGAAAGGGAPVAGNSLVPVDDFKDLSDKDFANNFYNDVVNKHYSPLEMQLRLSGYGFATFVNSCEHLTNRQRKEILPILQERRLRMNSTAADEMAFDRVFGPGLYQLVFNAADRTPRNLDELTEDEIRRLSIAAEEFNKNLVAYSDDDIKIIEGKFFDVLANSSVVNMYEASGTFMGRLSGWIDRLTNRQRNQVLKELRGSMCQYHREKVEQFKTKDERERIFKEILGRETVREPVKSQRNTNVPDLTKGYSALRQEAMDREK